ncbi:MAG TPA: class I SAM-dependent methyltransferase [Clostridia bacterium]|nr:MAG: Mg-protoporphyrin IX methyl transferase [Firmicutes bacterium ADurb.Bin248]HOG00322.1 class I SAM-dependent methyltransferase [Clostridia bacterium]HOS18485.1 class I SAM-dependent methyltransferase [Clostridia bacterium]HPK15003.1 class I SAM-dependent methyltransferase [Clostridia bacterium]
MNKPYYLAYEARYQKVFAAGVECWGHSPDDETLVSTLGKWVNENNLAGKKIIEFACGEGACGVILSRSGCRYRGVDIAASAIEKAQNRLRGFPDARVGIMDMVKERTNETYDAALDCMGFHMLVTDHERKTYLQNAFDSLKSGAPMLFFRESYRETAYGGKVDTYEQWKEICGEDYETPSLRCNKSGDQEIELWIPLVPGRPKSKDGYFKEIQSVGFVAEDFIEMDLNNQNPYSASIYARKP